MSTIKEIGKNSNEIQLTKHKMDFFFLKKTNPHSPKRGVTSRD